TVERGGSRTQAGFSIEFRIRAFAVEALSQETCEAIRENNSFAERRVPCSLHHLTSYSRASKSFAGSSSDDCHCAERLSRFAAPQRQRSFCCCYRMPAMRAAP